jgi:hypothetical protein
MHAAEYLHLTLPGTMPGLLRPGSPVLYGPDDAPLRGIVLAVHGDAVAVASAAWREATVPPSGAGYAAFPAGWALRPAITLTLADVKLDLSEPTGACHASWLASNWAVDMDRPLEFIAQMAAAGQADEEDLAVLIKFIVGVSDVPEE